MTSSVRPAPDQELLDMTDYVMDYKIQSPETIAAARLCIVDSLACAFDSLDYPDCTKLLGPVVPDIVIRNGARVPATRYELDPATAAFSFSCMIRWLDLNDTFAGAIGGHPSDNLAGILMLADYLSRQRIAAGGAPLLMSNVTEALVKAYEIQGCLAMENDLKKVGIDQSLFTRVSSAAMLTHMLGGTREQVLNAISNSWIDVSLGVFRHAPNTGSRKNWAVSDGIFQSMRLAFMALKGEMGYPSVLTAKHHGLYDSRFGGKPFKFQRPYGEYVIHHTMFKFIGAAMTAQSAIECAFEMHALVKDRIEDIARIEIHSQRMLMSAMDKTGPLYNPSDRDHCVQYGVAVGLIHGQLNPQDYEDDFAADPRIDKLRAKMVVTEDPRYTKDALAPDKRSSANSLQVYFKNGSTTPPVEIEYPAGHPRRRSAALPVLEAKFAASVTRRFPTAQRDQILALCADGQALERTAVNKFVDLLIMAQ